MNTPWGQSQQTKVIADGITWVSTASHGGYHLSDERRAAMPTMYRVIKTFAGGNWYEEDCDWSLVALSFPKYFTPEVLDAARSTLRWLAENSERFSPDVVLPAMAS